MKTPARARQHFFTTAAIASLGLIALTQCSSLVEDGASCTKDRDCSSSSCIDGACAGTTCDCTDARCPYQSTCKDGWLCARSDVVDSTESAQCHIKCGQDSDCTASQHCGANGVCRVGPRSFGLTWVTTFPRAVPCTVNVPCKYEVKVSPGTTVTKFTWAFGSSSQSNLGPLVELEEDPGNPHDTTEPTTEITFKRTGSFDLAVHAVATTGATQDLYGRDVCQ